MGDAACLGALTGAAMLATMGCESRTYYWLFGTSSIGRLLCLGLLAGVALPKGSLKTIRMRILSVRVGSVTAPIIASADESP